MYFHVRARARERESESEREGEKAIHVMSQRVRARVGNREKVESHGVPNQ